MANKTTALFLAVIASIALIGCAQHDNPIQPVSSHDMLTGSVVQAVAGTGTNGIYGASDSITTTNRITAADGGKVQIKGFFLKPTGDTVKYNASILIPRGALLQDTDISITIRKSVFVNNAQVDFAPHGLVFQKPGVLVLGATGIDLAQDNSVLGLLYLNLGIWQQMPSSWGVYVTNRGGVVLAGASIPHFSQYAFGRLSVSGS